MVEWLAVRRWMAADVLADDRKVGWNAGRMIEVIPHYQRPHLMLAWMGRAVLKVVPRRGSVVHREVVEKLPSGFGGGGGVRACW